MADPNIVYDICCRARPYRPIPLVASCSAAICAGKGRRGVGVAWMECNGIQGRMASHTAWLPGFRCTPSGLRSLFSRVDELGIAAIALTTFAGWPGSLGASCRIPTP